MTYFRLIAGYTVALKLVRRDSLPRLFSDLSRLLYLYVVAGKLLRAHMASHKYNGNLMFEPLT